MCLSEIWAWLSLSHLILPQITYISNLLLVLKLQDVTSSHLIHVLFPDTPFFFGIF